MKMVNQIFAMSFLIVLTACGTKTDPAESRKEIVEENQLESVETNSETANSERYFGKKIDENGAVSMEEFDQLIANSNDTLNVKISSLVKEVCKKKGCWMKIDLANGDLMRVTFKDYGFFVPEEIVNREVILEGKAFRDTTSIADLKHYAEDGGKSEEEIALITTPEIKTTFVAEGVIMK